MNDDTKRILSSLGTEEATKAFEAGGGGRKAEAERLLAEARTAASSGSKTDAKKGKEAHNDPRLRCVIFVCRWGGGIDAYFCGKKERDPAHVL